MASTTEQGSDPTEARKVGIAPGDDPGAWRIVQNIADPTFTRAELEAASDAGQVRWSRTYLERSREVAPRVFMIDIFDAGGGPGERGGMSSKWLVYRPDPARLPRRP